MSKIRYVQINLKNIIEVLDFLGFKCNISTVENKHPTWICYWVSRWKGCIYHYFSGYKNHLPFLRSMDIFLLHHCHLQTRRPQQGLQHHPIMRFHLQHLHLLLQVLHLQQQHPAHLKMREGLSTEKQTQKIPVLLQWVSFIQ